MCRRSRTRFLTNHRIVAQAEEPYPDAAFHMTSPQLPDLVHLTAIPGKRGESISPLLLLQAYGQLMTPNPEYRDTILRSCKATRVGQSE